MKKTTIILITAFALVPLICWVALFIPVSVNTNGFVIVEALFTGLAFAGVIYTIILQSKELELQRQELRDTRKEFEQQNETLRKQRFENTFFQLLTAYSNSVKNFSSFQGNMTINGVEAVRNFYSDLESSLKRIHTESKNFQPLEKLDIYISVDLMTKAYNNSFNKHLAQSLCAIYWRTIEFVHYSELSEIDKDFYAKILNSLVSEYDLRIIFYDYFFSDSSKPPIELIAYYNIFWRIKPESVILRSHYDHFRNQMKGVHRK